MPKFLGRSFVLLSLLSCQTKKPSPKTVSKEIVAGRYLQLIDSSENADSNDFKYKIIQKLLNGDSNFFKQLNDNLDICYRQLAEERHTDSLLHTGRLSLLGCEEAYRFHWLGAYCDQQLMVTIGKQKDNIRLEFIEYESAPGDSAACTITRQSGKSIPVKAWNHLKTTIDFAYFWSLESNDEYTRVPGGANWKVTGYQINNDKIPGSQRIHSVYRHSPGIRAFSAIGFEMLQLSGEKTTCFY